MNDSKSIDILNALHNFHNSIKTEIPDGTKTSKLVSSSNR